MESTPSSVGFFWILGMKFVVAYWCQFSQLQMGGQEGLPKDHGIRSRARDWSFVKHETMQK